MDSNRQIVVLDGYTLTHGDLDWEALREFGDVRAYDRTPPEQIAARAASAAIVLTNKASLFRDTLQQLPELRYIGVTATGTNIVDLDACRERGIVVTNAPGYSTDSVAQLTLSHLLNLTQRVTDLSRAVRQGAWSKSEDFCFWDAPLQELCGMTMGIVGFGAIGQAVARLATALGMRVIVLTRTSRGLPSEFAAVDRDGLLQQADVVSLHCPLTPETEMMVDSRWLSQMKRTAFLINTARGQLVDEDALARALYAGEIAGAGLDVLCQEPPEPDNPLFTAPNCYITPHIAWATLSSRKRLMQIVVENVAAYIAGKPQNVVS